MKSALCALDFNQLTDRCRREHTGLIGDMPVGTCRIRAIVLTGGAGAGAGAGSAIALEKRAILVALIPGSLVPPLHFIPTCSGYPECW